MNTVVVCYRHCKVMALPKFYSVIKRLYPNKIRL